MRTVGRLAVLCIAILSLISAPVHAETVTVTIGVGDTILEVSGQTSPDAFVTISKSGSVIGTAVADSNGAYSQTFPAQEPGIQQLSVFANTSSGQNTDTVTLNVNVAEHATTSVELFLPPTITIVDTSLERGQELVLNGTSAPSSSITVYIDNSSYATTPTNAQGLWDISLSTELLSSGQHSIFVRATNGIGEQSYPTVSRTFSLAAEPDVPPPSTTRPPAPAITFPKPGEIWHDPSITVEGTGGAGLQIELWDGSNLIGSVWSTSRGKWSIPLRLEQKAYELRARACLNQRCSAFSPIVRFSYEPDTPIAPNERPLKITVPRSSFTIYLHQTVQLRALVEDGQPPYHLTITWGDGQTETRSYSQSDLVFAHTYDKPGKYRVKVDIQDSQGRKNRIYYSVEVKPAEKQGLSPILPLVLSILALAFGWATIAIHRHRRNTAT